MGDDCAILAPAPGRQLCVSSDLLVEGRHFLSTVAPERLGHKALAVNLSDLAACGVLLAATAGTAISRVVADRHYFTDGLMGAAIGFGAGYGLPWLLHYRYGSSPSA